MKLGYWLGILAGASVLAAGACDYPTFGWGPAGTQTGTGGTGGGGGSGAGAVGAGGTTGSSTSTTHPTTTGGGGSGGTVTTTEPSCTQLGKQDICGSSGKCTVVDPSQGTLGCMARGNVADFAVCADNSDCGVSSWCDDVTGVCKPICADVDACTGTYGLTAGTVCNATTLGGQPVFGGLKVCSSHCDPMSPSRCSNSAGATNCVLLSTSQDWDCVASGGGGDGADCSADRDCAKGYACANETCSSYCANVYGCCGACYLLACQACQGFSSAQFYGVNEIGTCHGVTSC
jgi:hypothetical protein